MPRIPVRIQTSSPVGSSNPNVVTGRSLAPTQTRVLGPTQPNLHFPTYAQNRQQTAVNQALGQAKARYDADQLVIPGVTFQPEVVTLVYHGLGRAYVGANVINVRGVTSAAVPYGMFFIVPNGDARLNAYQVQIQAITLCVGDVQVF